MFLGAHVLIHSFGKPGHPGDPEVVAVIENVIKTALKHGKRIGIYIATEAALEKYIKLGVTYFAWKSDVTIFADAAKEACKVFNQHR